MAEPGSERERQRLARRYAAMSDEELSELAEDARLLTDAAKAALQAEITRRGADIALDETGPGGPPASPIILRRYLWQHEALLAKAMLDSTGVECFLVDEHTIRMQWLWSLALGGVKVLVRPEDADVAELLDQGWVESFVVSGMGEYVQPRCPNCGSFDVSYRGLLRRLAYFSLLLCWMFAIVPPIAMHELGWRCAACGHLWEDQNEVAETDPTA